MALARMALKNLQQRVVIPCSSIFTQRLSSERNVKKQRWRSELPKRLSIRAADDKSDDRQITVSESAKKSKLLPTRHRKRGTLWKNNHHDFVPALWGLGDAILEATENINKVLESLEGDSEVGRGRVIEKDEWYKVRFDLPGLAKENVKITVEDDGVLRIKGEHKSEDDDDDDDDEQQYINTSVELPDDAKVDEIKAEMKDGVLRITIPRTQNLNKDVKEVPVQ